MDKNTITGLILIGLLLIGFSYFSRPTAEQKAWYERQDSIQRARIEQEALQAGRVAEFANEEVRAPKDSTLTFFQSSAGTESFTTMENKLVKITFTNKGGRVYSAMLKEYDDQQKQPLVLFDGNEASMNFSLFNRREEIHTQDYYFTPLILSDSTIVMRLLSDEESYIDFIYTLHPDDYMLDFTIQAHGMDHILPSTTNSIDILWAQRARQQEKGFTFENRLSNLSYKFWGNGTDHLSEGKSEDKTISERLNWIAFKNQFFSSIFIADQNFSDSKLRSQTESQGSGYIKDYTARMSTLFDPKGIEPTTMHLYFGSNHYKTLKSYDKGREVKWELENLVYLGWPVVKQINRWVTINIFDWLTSWGLNMGVVLLILTIIVKIVIFPATWKTYMSSAKMRVLKPQIEKINEKYPKQEDALKKQQETMALYSKYGVSPLGGCLPMLVQFPILMALFMFVPSAIELRQQSFLWADDLSTYDAFINFPFKIPFLGSHLSLFCLLMTVTTILNTKYTMAQQDTGQQQIAGMKWMMYLMPVMFLFILNEYPAGLNYYYFISTLISVVTMIVLRKTTNEEKLLAQLEARKEKSKGKKKSGFAARLEAMQKEQERLAREQQKKKK